MVYLTSLILTLSVSKVLICQTTSVRAPFVADDANEFFTRRYRRAATQFYASIQCHQPGAIVLSLYGDYGCYCGFRGGGTALDETDRCCQIHDKCYAPLKYNVPLTPSEGLLMTACGELCVSYKHSCQKETIICAPDNTPMGKAICECDKAAAKCFSDARGSYDIRLANVDPSVYCSEKADVRSLLSELKRDPAQEDSLVIHPTLQTADDATVIENLPVLKHNLIARHQNQPRIAGDKSSADNDATAIHNITEETSTARLNTPGNWALRRRHWFRTGIIVLLLTVILSNYERI